MAKHKLERFDVRVIKRSQVNPAPYNPREISEHALKQLEKSLSKFGLAEPLIWNEQTGNLVGGHQRLSIMDRRAKYPAKGDYELTVSCVSYSLEDEKKLNVWLNNSAAQGHYTQEGLFGLVTEIGSMDEFGLSRGDFEVMFGAAPELKSAEAENEKSAEQVAAEIEAIKQRKKRVRKENADAFEEDCDYGLLVFFASSKDREDFLRSRTLSPTLTRIAADELFPANGTSTGQAGRGAAKDRTAAGSPVASRPDRQTMETATA